jgi:hypothetical protein
MLKRLVYSLILIGVLGAAGCAATEDTDSARPWNAPRGWEHGMPSGFYEGR